jgi:hypothetical protein
MARYIADRAGGREPILRAYLRKAGAVVLRCSSKYNTRGNQIAVRFPDGVIGFYAPGGPSHMITYQWFEGHRPGDDTLKGTVP